MSEEEKEAIEQEFQYALDEILSLVKYETATAIVHKEQSMILLFKKLLLKIDKLQKENHQLKDEKIDQIFKGVEEEVLEEMRTEVRTLRKENAELKEKIREYDIGKLSE